MFTGTKPKVPVSKPPRRRYPPPPPPPPVSLGTIVITLFTYLYAVAEIEVGLIESVTTVEIRRLAENETANLKCKMC